MNITLPRIPTSEISFDTRQDIPFSFLLNACIDEITPLVKGIRNAIQGLNQEGIRYPEMDSAIHHTQAFKIFQESTRLLAEAMGKPTFQWTHKETLTLDYTPSLIRGTLSEERYTARLTVSCQRNQQEEWFLPSQLSLELISHDPKGTSKHVIASSSSSSSWSSSSSSYGATATH